MAGFGDRHGTAFRTPVYLAAGTGTGVSAEERAATVRRLAHPGARPGDFVQPGHVIPLAARPGLLGERQGHTEATIALCAAAGLAPVGVCCEIMNADGTMAKAGDLEAAALRWGCFGSSCPAAASQSLCVMERSHIAAELKDDILWHDREWSSYALGQTCVRGNWVGWREAHERSIR